MEVDIKVPAELTGLYTLGECAEIGTVTVRVKKTILKSWAEQKFGTMPDMDECSEKDLDDLLEYLTYHGYGINTPDKKTVLVWNEV